VSGNVVQFPWRPKRLEHRDSRPAAERALAVPIVDRAQRADDLNLDDAELLLSAAELLLSRVQTAPAASREDAIFFYRFIEEPPREIGLHDERDYYLGEFALIAGAASRVLFRIEEARTWLQRSEAHFALVQNANAHWARVAYQRLALLIEERQLTQVLELAPMWAITFTKLEMAEDALKCRFLEGLAYSELGKLDRAIEVFTSIASEASKIGSERLLAQAFNNLVGFYADLGNEEQALSYAAKALQLQKRLKDRVGFAKLQWSIGDLLRKKGKPAPALESYRQAQAEAREIGLRGDLAALHLVIADLLLEAGQEAQAEWEIRAALPIIDEEKMVPEGIAALSLLRESLRRRQIDKQALRDLHGYFQEK